MENEKEKIKSPKNIYKQLLPVFIVLILGFVIMTVATTYAFFKYSRSGKNPSTVFTADMNILVDDHGNLGINQQNAFPVYDAVGRQSEPYAFTLKNLGTVEANYVLKLVIDEEAIAEDGCATNLLAEESVKVQLIKDDNIFIECLLSVLTDYQLDSGFIGLQEGINKYYNYELRLWIDQNAGKEVMGRHYHGRIDVILSDPLKNE